MVNRDILLTRRAKLLAQLELVNELLEVEAPAPAVPVQDPRPSSQAVGHLVEDSEDDGPKAVRLASSGARRKLSPLDLARILWKGPAAVADLSIAAEVTQERVLAVLTSKPRWFQKTDPVSNSPWALTELGQKDLPFG